MFKHGLSDNLLGMFNMGGLDGLDLRFKHNKHLNIYSVSYCERLGTRNTEMKNDTVMSPQGVH